MYDGACEIEATVVTGFESCAKEEVSEKFNVECSSERGCIRFFVPVEDVRKVLELKSVDNLCVVLNRWKHFEFEKNVDDTLRQFRNLVPDVNWQTGLLVWHKIFPNENKISPNPIEGWQIQFPVLSKVSNLDNVLQTQRVEESIKEDVQTQPVNDRDKPELLIQPVRDCVGAIHVTQSTPSQYSADGNLASKQAKTSDNTNLPKYRATCYRNGEHHNFQSPQAARHFGGAINDYLGWIVNLENYDIEVILNVNQRTVSVMLALTKESLHRRNLISFGRTSLRPTIAYNMLRLCKIQVGDIVCDPMCGSGSIPVESLSNWPSSIHLCGDNDPSCGNQTKRNFKAYSKDCGMEKSIGLFDVTCWDVTRLPLKTASVDVLITDLPFGIRSGHKVQNWKLYSGVLNEMARVCQPSTGRACFLTHDTKCFEKTLSRYSQFWVRRRVLGINMGGLAALVYLLHRTIAPFVQDKV